MAGDKQGLICPGCGGRKGYTLGDPDTATQAFCGNEDCHIIAWNPQLTYAELAADPQVVGIPTSD